MPIIQKLAPVQNVAANDTAILPRLPLGMTYHGLFLKLGGTFTKAQITKIRAQLDGKTFVDISGSQLDTINQYDGKTASATFLSLPFGDANARTIVGEGIGSIETLNNRSFDLEFDIGGATSPSLEVWASLGGPKLNRAYSKHIRAYLPRTHSPGAAGEFDLPVPTGSLVGNEIKRVHFFHSNITELTVTRDGLNLMQKLEEALGDFIVGELNRVPQTGHLAFEPTFNDDQSDSIPTYRNDGNPATFQFLPTISAADTITTITDLYAPSILHI